MRRKLGLPDDVDDTVVGELVDDLLDRLQRDRVDYTSFFRRLSSAARGECETPPASTTGWTAGARSVRTPTPWIASTPSTFRAIISSRRPSPLRPRAISAPLERLLAAVTSPYEQRPGFDRYAEPAPEEFGGCYQTFCGT